MANRSLTANKELRAFMDANKIRLWQLGDQIGLSENKLCAKLRHELSDQEKKQYFDIVKKIAKGETTK